MIPTRNAECGTRNRSAVTKRGIWNAECRVEGRLTTDD